MATKVWYSPGQVHFSRRTTLWLIQNLETLRVGSWPPDASNYIDLLFGRGKAYFETPIEYATEIETRLEKCGLDGLVLEAIESWDKTVESVAAYFKMPKWAILRKRKTALKYVASGTDRRWHDTKKRKGQSYKDFKEIGEKETSFKK